MDPITAISTVGAIANIIDVVGKTITSLRDLCDRWKDADFTIFNLIAQLTALRAALSKIREWIDSDLMDTPRHYQLIMDLDLSIRCCKRLVDEMDARVSKLDRTTDNTLDIRSKIRVVFGAKASEDLQKQVERQIGALTLLLTACNCQNISEQRVLLEKPSSRKVFNQVKDDSSSLFVLRDTVSSSRWSKYTDNLSKVFPFDRVLFVSKVYERALRGFAKTGIRRHEKMDMGLSESSVFRMTKSELKEQTERSKSIDRELEKHLVVGVDMGIMETAVAICSNGMTMPMVIQLWPGSRDISNTVPTKVAYKAGKARIHSWGFTCPSLEGVGPGMAVKEQFKPFLDKLFLERFRNNPEAAPVTIRDVKLWYVDFLSALYDHIVAHLKSHWLVDWNLAKVEYVFSIPTYWRDNDRLVENFEEIVKEAGFETDENCSVSMMAEEEAIVVYTMKSLGHRFMEGDTILVCNTGRATTDIRILKVNRIEGETVELMSLGEPKGLGVGSLTIDDAFEEYVAEYLRFKHPQLSKHAAHQTMKDKYFQGTKMIIGTKLDLLIGRFRFPVLGLPLNLNEWIEFSHQFKAMFDQAICKIFEFTDNECSPGLKIPYLILSGDLGRIQYVQEEFVRHYSARDITVLYSEEFSLNVCKGLVIDRMQRIRNHASISGAKVNDAENTLSVTA